MKIYTRVVRDIESWALLEEEWFWYSGPVDECKGGASKAEQAAADATRQKELDLMQNQLQQQTGYMKPVDAITQQIIDNGGMLPEQEAAMRSIFMNQSAQDFRDTSGMVNQNLVARGLTGGSNAGGGAVAQQFGQLGAMENQLKASGLNNIQLAKAQGLQNALGLRLNLSQLSGQNVGTFTGGANSALNAGVTAAHNVDTAGSSFWGPILGGALGVGASFIPKPKGAGCWIARAVYGETDPRAEFARIHLWNRADKEIVFALIMRAYMRFGERVALIVKRYKPLKLFFKCLFDGFLKHEGYHG